MHDDAKRQVNNIVLHDPTVDIADLHPQRAKNDDRIDPVRSRWQPLDFFMVGPNTANRRAGGIEANNLAVDLVDPDLTLLHQV